MAKTLTVRRYGGVPQLEVADHEDLAALHRLDEARWAATSAPLSDLHCDAGFLAAIDADKTGRVRVSQVLGARDWLFTRLAGRSRLAHAVESLALADLDATTDAGHALRAAAEHLLGAIGKADQAALTLAEVRAFRATYAQALENGDGIVPPEVVPEEDAAALAKAVIATTGGSEDASGRQGVSEGELARFLERAATYRAWRAQPDQDPAILPFAGDTASLLALVEGLAPKLDEYFWGADLAQYEAESAAALERKLEPLAKEADVKAAIEAHLRAGPLAAATFDGQLSLTGTINPAYATAWQRLCEQVVPRALGPDASALTREDWSAVHAIFGPYRAWQGAKPPEPFDALDPDALAGWLAGEAPGRLRYFQSLDLGAKARVERVADLERVLLYQRWLVPVANHLANFSMIYRPDVPSLVEEGTLIIDGRRLAFTVRVRDRAAHKKVAQESLCCLVYAQIRKAEGQAGIEVVAPLTAGERGRIRVGKRGLFVDRDGGEWDAEVTEMVEQPISVWEAARAPFRRVSRFVSEKLEAMAAARMEKAEGGMHAKAASNLPGAPPGAAPAPGAPAGGMQMQSALLVGGIAFAALGSAMAFVVAQLSRVNPLAFALTIASIVLSVGGIAGFLGWLKLRRRDLGVVLEAGGWAVNVELRVTRRLARLLTQQPGFPAGARHERGDALAIYDDPAVRRRRRLVTIAIIIVLAALCVGAARWWQVRQAARDAARQEAAQAELDAAAAAAAAAKAPSAEAPAAPSPAPAGG